MILLTFFYDNTYWLGVKTDQGVLDVAVANRALNVAGLADTPSALFSRGLEALPQLNEFVGRALSERGASAWLLDEARLQHGPCLPKPGKIICIGLNYRKHAQESKLEVPPVPTLFAKYQNAIAAPGEPIPLPDFARRVDHEAELGVVIGRRGKHIAEEDALSYVLGYCNTNDVSERELQNKTSQWMLGKTLDKFLPVGPYLLTADEAGDPQNWPVRCWMNGDLHQDSSTSDMIFPVANLVSFISRHMTLEPGDLISTGTPQGVISGRPQPREWLKAGDSVTIEVGPLGKLTNTFVQEETPNH